MIKRVLLILALILYSSLALAHSEDQMNGEENNKGGLAEYISYTSLVYIVIVSIIVLLLTILSILYKNKTERVKKVLFLSIIIPVILVTLYVAISTVYLNLVSQTKGPVHWHADFEIWNCNEKVRLIDPSGLSNRVGTSVFHVHGDDRIHVEGVVNDESDVDLHNFFKVIDGSLTKGYLKVRTNDGFIELDNRNTCSGEKAELQVFLYKVQNPSEEKKWVFKQEKLDDFEEHILSPYSSIPPGDCIIIELNKPRGLSEHICESYKATITRGELSGS